MSLMMLITDAMRGRRRVATAAWNLRLSIFQNISMQTVEKEFREIRKKLYPVLCQVAIVSTNKYLGRAKIKLMAKEVE